MDVLSTRVGLHAALSRERKDEGRIMKLPPADKGSAVATMADSFARLFRQSKWARLDLGLQRTVSAGTVSPPSRPLFAGLPVTGVQSPRPEHFGLKHDLPSTFHGRAPGHVLVRELDGDFGQATVEHADNLARSHQILQELIEAQKAGRPVPCRILNRIKRPEGYVVGVAGLTGRIPASEIPDGMRITFADMAQKRALWMWLKNWHITDGKIFTNFTLYRPLS